MKSLRPPRPRSSNLGPHQQGQRVLYTGSWLCDALLLVFFRCENSAFLMQHDPDIRQDAASAYASSSPVRCIWCTVAALPHLLSDGRARGCIVLVVVADMRFDDWFLAMHCSVSH